MSMRAGAHQRQHRCCCGAGQQGAGRLWGHQPCRPAGPQPIAAWSHWQRATMVPTVNDVPEALGVEKVTQTCHLVLQLPDELVVGVLVDDSIAADLLGTVSVPREGQGLEHKNRGRVLNNTRTGAKPQLLGKQECCSAPPVRRIPVPGQSFGLLSGVAGSLHSTPPRGGESMWQCLGLGQPSLLLLTAGRTRALLPT